jgi:hypothetical protein
MPAISAAKIVTFGKAALPKYRPHMPGALSPRKRGAPDPRSCEFGAQTAQLRFTLNELND